MFSIAIFRRLQSYIRVAGLSDLAPIGLVAIMLLTSTQSLCAEDRSSHYRSAMAAIFEEEILSTNIRHVREQAASLPVDERYRMLCEWVLPNSDRSTFRFRGEFSQSFPPPDHGMSDLGGKIESPALDLIESARQSHQLAQLTARVNAIAVTDNLAQRQQAALLFFIAMAQEDREAAKPALANFAAFFEPFNLNEPERYWSELMVASIAAGVPELGQTVQDLMVEFHKHRLQYFGDPRTDVFLDHARWLHGLQEYCSSENVAREMLLQEISLKNWSNVSYWEANSRGNGKPLARWQFNGKSARKIGGHEYDHLMFRMPLRGNYEIECDYSCGADTNSTMMVAGFNVSQRSSGIGIGSYRKASKTQELMPPLSKAKTWIHFRAQVSDGMLTQWMNGRIVLQRPLHPEHDPWIALRSWRRYHSELKNVRITGTPQVPETINLTSDPELSGWAPYFEESFGSNGNWGQQETRGGNAIYGRFRPNLAGTFTEKLIRYHRPLLEDGEICYDFFYKPGETMVHPALDRCCFMLNRDGVRIHWLTDREHDPTDADPANLVEAPTARRGPDSLPLNENDWNHLSLKLVENVVQLRINEQLVFERQMEADNPRTFGLFHYADQTDALIRDVTWKGDWPRTIPPIHQQELRGTETDVLDQRSAELKGTLIHDFKDGVPSQIFDVGGDAKAIEQLPDGIRVSLNRDADVRHLETYAAVKGDFDVEVQFRDLGIEPITRLTTGIALVLFFDTASNDNCGLYRRYQGFDYGGPVNEHQLLFAHKQTNPDGKLVYSGSNTAEESLAGRIRIARRGTTLTALYAEDDSPFFRIIATRKISPADSVMTPIRLLLQAEGTSRVQVVWQKLTIQAEEIVLPAEGVRKD